MLRCLQLYSGHTSLTLSPALSMLMAESVARIIKQSFLCFLCSVVINRGVNFHWFQSHSSGIIIIMFL